MQIVSRIRADILGGKYPPDSQIPAVRQLALEAAVNPNTMQRALTQLEDDGLLAARGTVGRFVTSDQKILAKAREALKKETLEGLVNDAEAVGITREEIIAYLTQEGK